MTMTRPCARGADALGDQADVLPGEFLQTRFRLERERTLDSHCGENDGAVGGNDDDKALRKGRRRTEWSGRRPTGEFLQTRFRLDGRKGSGFPLR